VLDTRQLSSELERKANRYKSFDRVVFGFPGSIYFGPHKYRTYIGGIRSAPVSNIIQNRQGSTAVSKSGIM
jgi:hypothetical protein